MLTYHRRYSATPRPLYAIFLLDHFGTRHQSRPLSTLGPHSSIALDMLLRHCLRLTRTCPPLLQRWHSVSNRTFSTAARGAFVTPTRTIAKPRALLQPQKPQRRGAKRKATVALDELPQGAIEGAPLPPQDDTEPDYPPLLQQVRNNMLKFSHCVLVTRVGGFYEVLLACVAANGD